MQAEADDHQGVRRELQRPLIISTIHLNSLNKMRHYSILLCSSFASILPSVIVFLAAFSPSSPLCKVRNGGCLRLPLTLTREAYFISPVLSRIRNVELRTGDWACVRVFKG